MSTCVCWNILAPQSAERIWFTRERCLLCKVTSGNEQFGVVFTSFYRAFHLHVQSLQRAHYHTNAIIHLLHTTEHLLARAQLSPIWIVNVDQCLPALGMDLAVVFSLWSFLSIAADWSSCMSPLVKTLVPYITVRTVPRYCEWSIVCLITTVLHSLNWPVLVPQYPHTLTWPSVTKCPQPASRGIHWSAISSYLSLGVTQRDIVMPL